MRITPRLWIHAAATLALVGAVSWLVSDGGWEPALAVLAAIGGYIKTLADLIKGEQQHGAAEKLSAIVAETGRSRLEDLVPEALTCLAESRTPPKGDERRILLGVLGILFKKLQILGLNKAGQLQPVSERAASFLRIMADSAEKDIAFGGNWRAEGTQNSVAVRAGDVLERLDLHRIEHTGGMNAAKPIRRIACALALLKASVNDEPALLLRWSDSWGGYYWFVGGIQEDGETPEACVRRELQEEVGITRDCIQSVTPLVQVHDRRLSARQRVLTEYTYHLFAVSLDEHHLSCAQLLQHEAKFNKIVPGGHRVTQMCRWHTWDEVKASPALLRDAGAVIAAIERYGFRKVPLSISSDISVRPDSA